MSFFGAHLILFIEKSQSLVFGEAEGKHADADALNVLEGVGTCDECGTSSTDIIDEQNVAVA